MRFPARRPPGCAKVLQIMPVPPTSSRRPIPGRPPLEPASRLQFLPGVGPQRAEAFARLGLSTVEHLMRHYPRTWLDARRFVRIADLRPGELLTV
jgi:ATP-dependent DNA helicase RecG